MVECAFCEVEDQLIGLRVVVANAVECVEDCVEIAGEVIEVFCYFLEIFVDEIYLFDADGGECFNAFDAFISGHIVEVLADIIKDVVVDIRVSAVQLCEVLQYAHYIREHYFLLEIGISIDQFLDDLSIEIVILSDISWIQTENQ